MQVVSTTTENGAAVAWTVHVFLYVAMHSGENK